VGLLPRSTALTNLLHHRTRHSRRSPHRPLRRRLELEPLESRSLPSTGLTFGPLMEVAFVSPGMSPVVQLLPPLELTATPMPRPPPPPPSILLSCVQTPTMFIGLAGLTAK
jgi:hypothetical protein